MIASVSAATLPQRLGWYQMCYWQVPSAHVELVGVGVVVLPSFQVSASFGASCPGRTWVRSVAVVADEVVVEAAVADGEVELGPGGEVGQEL